MRDMLNIHEAVYETSSMSSVHDQLYLEHFALDGRQSSAASGKSLLWSDSVHKQATEGSSHLPLPH